MTNYGGAEKMRGVFEEARLQNVSVISLCDNSFIKMDNTPSAVKVKQFITELVYRFKTENFQVNFAETEFVLY